MAQKKISQFPQDSSPTATDSIPTYDAETALTKRVLISDLITLFFNNVPAGANSPITRWSENGFDYVASACVWTGDSVGVNRNASMTAGVVYINGRRIIISAVVARTFTASKDTYIDILDNNDGTGTLVYTEVANNAASPSLAANSMRIGIIVTGATTIAAAGSVNQGQENKILPIASSIAYTVTDSIGNMICPRDPNRKVIGYRQIIADFTTTTVGSFVDITGLNVAVNIPPNRKIVATAAPMWVNTSSAGGSGLDTDIYDVTSSVEVGGTTYSNPTSGYATNGNNRSGPKTPAASGFRVYKVRAQQAGAGTITYHCTSTIPAYVMIELEG